MFIRALLILILIVNVRAQMNTDNRCRHACSSTSSVSFSSAISHSRLYHIPFVPPNMCNNDNVILLKVEEQIKLNAELFCGQCECKHETRDTSIMLIGTYLIIWCLLILLGYYLFQMVLKGLTQLVPHFDETLLRHDIEILQRLNRELVAHIDDY